MWSRVETTTLGKVIAVTSGGRALVSPAAAIAEVTGRSRGMSVTEAFTTQKGEVVLALVASAADDEADDRAAPLLLVTANGVVKRCDRRRVGRDTRTANRSSVLKPGDAVVAAFPAADDSEFAMLASNAQALRCDARLGQHPRSQLPPVWPA